jgi:hypothetical protein
MKTFGQAVKEIKLKLQAFREMNGNCKNLEMKLLELVDKIAKSGSNIKKKQKIMKFQFKWKVKFLA